MTFGEQTRTGSPVTKNAFWAVLDQAFSSVSNVLLSIAIASRVSPVHFGAYSLAFASCMIAVGLCRAVGPNAFILKYSRLDPNRQLANRASLLGMGAGVGALSAVVAAAVGVAVLGTPIAPYLLALAIVLPGLLWQDAWRYIMFSARNARGAFYCDALWLALEVPTLYLAWRTSAGWPAVLAWGGSGTAAALIYSVRQGCWPSITKGLQFFRATAPWRRSLVAEYGAVAAGDQLLPFAVAMAAGLTSVGQLRAAQIGLGIANTALLGVSPVVLSHFVYMRAGLASRSPSLFRWTVGIIGATWLILTAGILLTLPASIGQRVAGASWSKGRELLLPLALGYGFQWLTTVNLHAIRAALKVAQAARVRTCVSVAILAGTTTGAALGLAQGAAWGLALGGAVGAAISLWACRSLSSGHEGSRLLSEQLHPDG